VSKESWRAFLGTVGTYSVLTVFCLLFLSVMFLVTLVGVDQIISKGNFIGGFLCLVFICYMLIAADDLWREWRGH